MREKLFVYNFNGDIVEIFGKEAFNDEIRRKTRECYENGEPMSRQVIDGEKISNEKYFAGIWLPE